MTKYTKDAPFEFEGVKVWREDDGHLKCFGGRFNEDQARAYHAFIEAERNEWAWTNDEHTEARKGRFVARSSTSVDLAGQQRVNWILTHDDFPTFPGLKGGSAMPTSKTKKAVELRRSWWDEMQDFLAWHAAQNQPAEPTGLGAVVKVGEVEYVLVSRDEDDWMPVGEDAGGGLCSWLYLTELGPVTILSPGVEA